MRASAKLMAGKRMEVADGLFYMGSADNSRRDAFWYEGPQGRTYKERPEPIVREVLRRVGAAAIEHAKVFAS